MTTVLVLARSLRRTRVEGILRWAVLVLLASGSTAAAQDRPVHWLNAGALPPGAIGSLRLHRGGPLSGYFQPVRIRAPEGARIALALEDGIQNSGNELVVGLNIGPVYRLQVGDIPNHPGLELYPTVEVIDRLYPPPCLALRFPIPVELTSDELDKAATGSFITRVIYVEDPHTALPVAEKASGEQRWVEAPPGEDPLVTADGRGRPVAIVRIGGRTSNAAAEAMRCGLAPPGHVFDAQDVAEAGLPHCDDQCCPCPGSPTDPYGPLVGPGDEYICDGGDFISPAGVRADWTIDGLEQEDAIGHYDTLQGELFVVPSNRVCIYAPRFAAIRRLVQPIVHEQPVFVNATYDEEAPMKAGEAQLVASSLQRHAPAIDIGQRPPSLLRGRQQAGGLENLQATMVAYQSISPAVVLEVIRTGEVSNAEKPLIERAVESAIALTGVQAPQVLINVKQAHAMVGTQQVGIIYQSDEPNHPRLRLLKLASCGNALPGEEIEFTLRYDNIGDQIMGNVTIVDNLSTRFEYIPESAKSSVDAQFITQPNEGESLILRWEIKDPVKPGEGGVLRFRVRVR
jgi:uncharacterized repeat protein (TIGR01451 family)